MSNKVTKILGVDLDLPALQAAVQKANKLIDNMGKNGQPPTGLTSSFNKIDKILDKLAAKTKDGVFKGTDAEYAAIIRELGSVGEEFEHVERIITKLSKMDDDALSKFLKKEDLKVFKDSTKALKEYYDIVKKLEGGDSSVLTEAKKTKEKATKVREEAKFKMDRRKTEFEEKEASLKSTGVLEKRESVKTAKSNLDSSQKNLKEAEALEKTHQAALKQTEDELKTLEASLAAEKSKLAEELAELTKAKAAFTNIKKFYAEKNEDGTERDITQDYTTKTGGVKSYKAAEARVAAAEAKVKNKTDLEEKIKAKKVDISKASEDKAAASALKVEAAKVTETYINALEEEKKALVDLEKQHKTAIEEYEAADKAYKDATAEVNRFTRAEEDAEVALQKASEENIEAANKTKDLEKAYEKLYAKARELGLNLDELGIGQEYSAESAEKLVKALEANKKTLVDNVRIADDYETTLDEMDKALDENRENVEANAEAQKKLNEETAKREEFENKIKQFLGMAGAAQVLRAALRNAMDTIKELDATMTEMSVVTDLGVGDYWDQLPEYTKRANELGLAINDVYKADTLFYQQGLKTNEVVELSTETMKMAKIAGLDTAEATDRMTAALRGFNMELDKANAQKISDVYSELAAITAADVEEISSAMTKTASIASSAGMEFETTAAFLSQIIETTRESAETAGTAMKTVIARFQELKKAPDEIGEIDGEIVDANAIETALRSVGVSLRSAGGQFRELDDVFLELSSKWDTLDKNTQRYIATIAAGSRQQSRFIAMMSDYGRTQELVTAANNSAGASARQYEKTVDSLETKLNKLKNAWNEFAMGILESDLVKTGVEILTKFLEIINKATSAFDGLGGSIAKIMTVLMVFKLGSKLFEKLKKPLMEVYDWAVSMASPKGEEAGKKYGEGFVHGFKEVVEAVEKSDKDKPKEEQPKSEEGQKAGIGTTIAQKSGWADINEGLKKRKKGRELRSRQINAPKARERYAAAATKYEEVASNYAEDTEEYKKAYADLTKAQKDCAKYTNLTKEELDELAIVGKEGTEQMAKGFAKMGEAAIGAGVGISMLGGLLSSLGSSLNISWLEGVGEGISVVGNSIIMVGTAITAIIPIITLLSTVIKKGGQSAQAAWWWAIVIVAAVAALVVGIIAIANAVKNASPEAKLEEAEAAADRAAEAADRAAESYENLVNALDELDGKYEALDELTQGTKEWNEAVRDINNSVLDLIDEYPELAKFVENKSGVLTIDVDSAEVQGVLRQAEIKQVNAKNESIMANAAVLDAQNQVDFGKLDAVEQVANKRGWGTFGTATGVGAVLGGAAGAVVGMITGAIVGPINAAATASDEQLQEAVEGLAESVSMGETGTDFDSMYAYLTEEMGVAADEAKILAEEFSNDTSALIEYGNSVHAAEEQQKAAYEAIASSAWSLANTMNMSAEQIQQGSNLVDGDLIEQYYKEEMAKFNGKELKHMNDSDEVNKAIREKYGASAELKDDGTVEYNGEDGRTSVKLTLEEIKSLVATSNATERATTAIENSDEAIKRVASTLGQKTGDKLGAKSAIEAMYMSNNGGALTKADLDMLKAGQSNISEIWKSLSPEEKLAYGNNEDNLKEDFEEAIKGASKVLVDGTFDYMTADMEAGFNAKLDDVLNKTGGETARNEVKTATKNLLSRQSTELQQEIQALINATDWTNLESLKALQIELQNSYGYSEKEASNYIKTLGDAAYATSSLTTTIGAFGEFYQANQKVEDSLRRISDLQREYNNTLEDGQKITTEMLQAQAAEYENLAKRYEERYNASTSNLSKIGARGYDKTQFGTYNLWDYVSVREDGSLDTSKGASGLGLQDLLSSNISDDLREKIEKWVEDYNTEWQTQQESLDGLKDAADEIRDLEAQGKDAYYELRDMVKETVLDKMQKQIDIQQDTLDATRTANQNLINKIQEQIDTTRQEKQNQEAEENISNLRSQAAYLGMDTSGSNALQLAQLEEQTKQAEEDYLNTRIDQSIQSLQDANAKAEEQRERQIILAEQQLAAYQNSPEFQARVDAMLEEMTNAENWRETEAGRLLYDKFTAGLSSSEAEQWATDIGNKIVQANGWEKGTFATAFTTLQKKIDTLPTDIADAITTDSSSNALINQVSNLRSKGISDSTLEALGVKVDEKGVVTSTSGGAVSKESQDKLDNISQYMTSRDKGGTTDDSMEYLDSKKISYLTESEYYDKHIKEIAAGEEVASYEDYLNDMVAPQKAKEKMLAMINSGGVGLRGMEALLKDPTFQKYLNEYETKYGEDATESLKQEIAGQIKTGAVNNVQVDGVGDSWDNWDKVTIKIPGQDSTDAIYGHDSHVNNDIKQKIEQLVGPGQQGWMVMVEGEPYLYDNGNWHYFDNNPASGTDKGYRSLKNKYLAALRKYKTGGIADFTGPAWLDGTPSKPEYVLNSRQTERFFSLVDVLEDYKTDDKKSKTSGDNYFEIEINVEKLENDYDVEKIANKIRSMIYNDATYRNVNAINHIR